MTGQVIICGWGRVGRATAEYLAGAGHDLVVVDRDQVRLEGIGYPHVLGDVTDDSVLSAAGIDRAHALIAALDTDADNVYVTLSARALRRDLVIVARARNDASKSKLVRAGADRVVNPQLLGGRRMATFALQPHVAEFLDGVIHDESLNYRMEQIDIDERSPLAGRTLADAALAERSGVLVLAIRARSSEAFQANPEPSAVLSPGSIVIVVGTLSQLDALHAITGTR
jgi:voltage-gated potassium channel